MNERLRELAEQTGATHKQSLGVYQFYQHELADFAEAIVRECVTNLEFHGFEDAVPYIKWMAANKLGVEL